jgi:hypothetical protein
MDNNEKLLAPGAKKNNSEKDVRVPKGRSVTGKPLDAINVNPQDPKTSNLEESENSTAVMAFGRYNPPTVGHEKLINKVKSTADEHSGSAHIFASHSENTSKDPLPQSKKIGYLKKVAGKGTEVHGSSKSEPTIFHAASKLHAAGNKHLVVVAGSDRVNEYKDKLEKYNGKEGKHGFFSFDSIKFVSAGERDPDAEGAEGMSGTKLRAHARAGEMKQFKSGLPKALHPHADEIANHIRTVGEGVEETELEERVLTLQQRRQRATQMRRLEPVLKVKRAMAAKRLAGQVQLTRRARKQAKDILRRRIAGRRGSSYHQLGPSDKINIDRQVDPKVKLIKFIAARLMPRIKQAEVQRFTAKQLGKSTRVKATGPVIQHYEHDPLLNLFVEMAEKDVYISENNFKALEKKSEKYGIELVQMFEMYRDAYLSAQELEEQTKEQAAFISINAQCARLAEGLKDPKDNPCWKGYKPVGTKMKNGKQVPNCVPEETTNEAYYAVKPADVEAHRKAWQSGQITRGEYIKRVGLSAKKTARSPNEYTSPSDQPAAKAVSAKTGTLGKVAPPKSTSVLGTFKRFASSFGEAVEEGSNNSKARYDAKLAMASKAAASRAGSTKPLIRTKSEPELKHRVSVTLSDPQHTMVSKRGEKVEKKVRLYARDEKHAEELAKHHFKKQGYKVHDSNYIGVVDESKSNDKQDGIPFTPDKPKKSPSALAGKHGQAYSTVRHLARMAMQKQMKNVKEEVDPAHKKILNKAKTSVPKTPKSDYERKVVSYLKKKYSEEVEHIDEASLTAGKRLISKHGEGNHTVRVYKDTEYNEYQVHHYKDGKHMGEGPVSYHSDKEDAESTAKASLKQRMAMKEGVDQIDELKKSTLASYVMKAADSAKSKKDAAANMYRFTKQVTSAMKKSTEGDKRIEGIKSATKRLAKEEVEQINELSKSTVKSYLKKKLNTSGVPTQKDVDGIARATTRLMSKEEVEHIDELKKSTLGSYIKKASQDKADMANTTGFRAGVKQPAYNTSDETSREVKRSKGIAAAVKKLTKEDVEALNEKLPASATAGDYVSDFKKSDAPQFQGKSKEKRRQMAIAAYLAAKRK